jgi:hypothetical protein
VTDIGQEQQFVTWWHTSGCHCGLHITELLLEPKAQSTALVWTCRWDPAQLLA